MEDLFEDPSWYHSEPRYRRLKFFPLEEALEARPTAELATPDCVGKQGEESRVQQYRMKAASPASPKEWEEKRWLVRQATLRLVARDGAREREKRWLAQQATMNVVSANGLGLAGGGATPAAGRPVQQEKPGSGGYSPEFDK